MKFAIISDVHDNLANLKKALNYCKKNKIKTLVCCGDLATFDTLLFLRDNFDGKIYFVLGNIDDDHLKNESQMENFKKNNKDMEIFGETGEIEIGGLSVAITHFPKIAKKLFAESKYDLVFFGHTHRPDIKENDKTKMINPGTTGGVFYQPTFAVFDTEKNDAELVLLNEIK